MSAPRLVPNGKPNWLDRLTQLGSGPLTEAGLRRHVHPLFSQALAQGRGKIFLLNHSLGRPLDQTQIDVNEAVNLWYRDNGAAWIPWLTERDNYRQQVADIIGAANGDCILPKTNAGQALRAVLNAYKNPPNVLTSRGEFNSIDFILKVYAQRHRIQLNHVEPDPTGYYRVEDFIQALNPSVNLVVISMVMFTTGQLLTPLQSLIDAAHEQGIRVLVDLFHTAGVIPLDIQSMDADFAIGGCYKYLRGGPGTGWLYIHPRHLGGQFQTLDTGWFAQAEPLEFQRPEIPQFAVGGNAWMESTPAVLPFYQARAGLAFTKAIGVKRLREHSIQQQQILQERLLASGIQVADQPGDRGAFLAVEVAQAAQIAEQLMEQGIFTDARHGRLRLCPDILLTEADLDQALTQIIRIVS